MSIESKSINVVYSIAELSVNSSPSLYTGPDQVIGELPFNDAGSADNADKLANSRVFFTSNYTGYVKLNHEIIEDIFTTPIIENDIEYLSYWDYLNSLLDDDFFNI